MESETTTTTRTLDRALRMAALVSVAVFLLAPSRALGSYLEMGGLIAVWTAVVFGVTESRSLPRRVAFALAGMFAALLWMVDLETWMIAAVTLVMATAFARLMVSDAGARERRADLLLGPGVGVLAPLALTGLIAAFGGVEARQAVVGGLALAWPGCMTAGIAATLLAACTWVVLSLAAPSSRNTASRATAVVIAAFSIAVVLVLAARLVWIVSKATLPTDMLIWSEPPILLNLLKLHVGATFYGPMRLANSYSYSPMLELVHHCLLRPFGLDLSLFANRVLILCWQAGTVCLLAWAIWPRVAGVARAGRAKGSRAFVIGVLALVVLSSLLAPFVHPDHPLMTCLALAVALLVAEDQMPRRLFLALLFCAPILATCFKLTGAGFGLGLFLAFLWERRWREVGVLAVSGVCALLTIPLFNATLGAFSAYAIELQASHPIEWHKLWRLATDVPGRLGLLGLVAFAAARLRAPRATQVVAARRVVWLTFGSMTTSSIAFAKFGGRTNDLLPLSIGAVVVLLLSLAALIEGDAVVSRAVARLFPALGLVVGLELCPLKAPVLGRTRREIVAQHVRLVKTLRAALAAGRRPLFYSGTLAWLDAGQRSIPLDREQSVIELYLGHRPEVQAHLDRLDSGRYGMIIAAATTFWGGGGTILNGLESTLKAHIRAHYRLVEPRHETQGARWPSADGSRVVVFRWRTSRRNARSAVP